MMIETAGISTRRNTLLPLIALCLGFFMVIIDVMVVNVALPSIAKDLAGNFSGLQWVVAGYTLTFASLLLSAGYLGDQVGAKPTLLWGLIIFILTSLGCGIAPNMLLLVIFRFFQGASAALLVPTSLSLINASYEDNRQRAKAIGIWASIGGIAGGCGPVLGAVLTTYLGWRSIFLINIPIGLAAILLTVKYVANPTVGDKKGHFDFRGQILGIMSVTALAFSLIEAGNLGWLSTAVILSFGIFLLAFTTFLWIEHRAIAPMFPLWMFQSKTFCVSTTAGFILNVGGYGLLFILPFYFQQIRHYSVLMTGLALLPMVALGIVIPYFSGRLVGSTGPKLAMFLGLLLGALGYFSLLITGENSPSYLALILPLVAIGLSSLCMPAATIAVIQSVPEGRAGTASGAFNTCRQVGSLLGIAVFGTIIHTSPHFMTGMHRCLIIAGVLFLTGCLIILFFPKEK